MKKVREAKQGQILEQKEFADSPSEKIAELAVKDPENVQFKKFTALWNCYMRQVRNLFLICPRTRELLADWILLWMKFSKRGLM